MPSYTIRVQRLESVPLAVVRRQARQSELSRIVPECCGLVWNVMKANHVKAGRHVAIYWDSVMNVEIGVELLGPFEGAGEVVRSATPAGLVVSTTHLGPYGGLGAANEAIRQWCRTNNQRYAGPSWEVYGHWLPEWDSDPSRIRTDVYYLLAEGDRKA
jgi:effector-binding domain-containing protein